MTDLVTGALTWRRLGHLLAALPRDSALAGELLGDDAPWDLSTHLLAGIVDALHVANYQRVGKGPKPRRLPRPGVGTVQRIGTAADRDTVVEFLARFAPPSTVDSPD